MRPQRPQTWTIEETDRGTFDVARGNRPIATGLTARSSAEAMVRVNRSPGEKVWLVDPDGYRTDLTRHYPDPPPEQPSRPGPVSEEHRPILARYLARYGRHPQQRGRV